MRTSNLYLFFGTIARTLSQKTLQPGFHSYFKKRFHSANAGHFYGTRLPDNEGLVSLFELSSPYGDSSDSELYLHFLLDSHRNTAISKVRVIHK